VEKVYWEDLLEVARFLGQELLQSRRQQKHCVEVLWSKDRKSTLLSPSFETFKKYFLYGQVGKTRILYLSSKKIHTFYTNVTRRETMLDVTIIWGEGVASCPPPPEISK
jgi:hypothetical protein